MEEHVCGVNGVDLGILVIVQVGAWTWLSLRGANIQGGLAPQGGARTPLHSMGWVKRGGGEFS